MPDKQPSESLSISAVSLLLAIPVPTIRSWERRYAFPSPARTSGSHRRYGIEEVDQLRRLRDEIAAGRRTQDAVLEVRRHVSAGPGSPARWIDGLLEAAMSFDSGGIRKVIEEATIATGVDRTIASVLLPVLREIGTRWEAGKCDVANEHFASQEIRRWLSSQLALTSGRQRIGSVLLACGPRDMHSIGLEGFYVILSRRGWNCHYLGELTPTESLVTAVQAIQPMAVIVASQMGSHRRSTILSLRAAKDVAHGRVFYAGRAFMSARSRRGVPGTYLGEDMVEAADVLRSTLTRTASA